MKSFQKSFLIFSFLVIFVSNFSVQVEAANILGFNDPKECVKDTVLPVLVICGRNKTSAGTCQQYTNPCTFSDLVSMGGRVTSFIILLGLLIVPLIIMWYGLQIIIQKNWSPDWSSLGFSKGGPTYLAYLKANFTFAIICFILMLSAWLIVRTIVDVFQVNPNINTFLIDENGTKVQARQVNIN